jgi:hypothetical protein
MNQVVANTLLLVVEILAQEIGDAAALLSVAEVENKLFIINNWRNLCYIMRVHPMSLS